MFVSFLLSSVMYTSFPLASFPMGVWGSASPFFWQGLRLANAKMSMLVECTVDRKERKSIVLFLLLLLPGGNLAQRGKGCVRTFRGVVFFISDFFFFLADGSFDFSVNVARNTSWYPFPSPNCEN